MGHGFNTRAVQSGEFREERAGNITTPIFESSTFLNPNNSPVHYLDHTRNKNFIYTRWGNPTLEALEKKYAALDHVEESLSFSTGMGAITSTVLSQLKKGDRLLSIKELYGETFTFFKRFLPTIGIEVDLIKLDEMNAGTVNLNGYAGIYTESIVNPTLGVCDIQLLGKRAGEVQIPLFVDATFASPFNQNPSKLGATFTMHSGTKYISGHNDIMLGLSGFEKYKMGQVWAKRTMLGASPDPIQAYLGLRGLKTLGLRMKVQNENAFEIARFLSEHRKVERTFYPGLDGSTYYSIARRNLTGYGGMVSFELKGGLESARRLASRVKIFASAASLGGVESLLTLPVETSHANLTPEERRDAGIADGLVRMSVGIEDKEDLIEDLKSALE
ncbi:MAG: PLP-dependent transferase [Candidatus Thermoplasmatota archaeon]|jgi:cystathionine beta-lyase/cystathionine gamma-synthase|nr:PLP-dependent transferase [Candidatus Thermoplasmatota archaeon]